MIGSPSTPKSKKGVRKRVMMGPPGGLPSTYGHPSMGLSSSGSPTSMVSMGQAQFGKARYKTPMERIKNSLRSLLVISLPVSIFLLPFLLSSNRDAQEYPPVIVTVSTTPDRVPFLQPTLESILKQQSLPPTRVYLILMDPAVQDDILRGNLGFQKEFDLLEEYEKKEISSSSSLPQYLQHLVDTTTLTVLQPKIGLGPLSRMVYALEHETAHNLGEDKSSLQSVPQEPARLIYLDDDVVYDNNLLRQLVDASLDHPQAAVALTGARLRDRFRQVRYADPTSNNDKIPNLIVHSWNTHGEEAMAVDIVQAVTGVCVPTTLLNHTQVVHDILPQMMQQEQQQDTLPDNHGTDDIIISAVMETLNVTRLLVPASLQDAADKRRIHFANYSTNILSETGKSEKTGYSNTMEWLETLQFLQKRLGVWKQHKFLDPGTLTAKQKQAIACEALHEPDCESNPDACLPSTTECPDAQSVLSELESKALNEAEQSNESGNDAIR